jgi:two-component system, chemotaxis family, CheB/CheR fusion protein
MAKSAKATTTNSQPAPAAATSQNKNPGSAACPLIVGIGASAGGLEALEQFLKGVPPGSGLAFVVIQHQDPTYQGILPELLQRITPMQVQIIRNKMKIKPECVYVIPTNKDLAILNGVLHLLEPDAPRGLRLPIDFFFRSLAQDKHEMAIGVILSGMGSDGSLGLRAIKEQGGLVLAQEPASAKFNAMPRNAIDAGLADIVAPAEELANRIIDYFRHTTPSAPSEPVHETEAVNALAKIVILLREHTGNDFSLYKKNTLFRRIERRMGLHQLHQLSSYVRYLRENPQEVELLFKELLIGVTNFFRDPLAWEELTHLALPALLARHPTGKALRAWVPACSSGEEAYSLAMAFKEALEQIQPQAHFTLQIFATDLDQDAIDKARLGCYPVEIAADVSPERLSRFFTLEENNQYRVNKEIREMVIFAPQNLIMEPPFTKLDILSCRNLLIYLGPKLQHKLIPLFHYALNRHGILLLGNAETVGGFTTLFAPLSNKARLYRRLDSSLRPTAIDFPVKQAPAVIEEPKALILPGTLQYQADHLLLQNFAPAAVLVNSEGDILYINGRTGKYLEPAAGKANWNIYVMARDGLRHALAGALKQVVRQQGTVKLDGLKIADSSGAEHHVNLTVQMIQTPATLNGMVLIVFSDAPAPAPGKMVRGAAAIALKDELKRAHEQINTLREEMQTSQEELTSTNEELQSTNEELQSTNEELTTSKEEMQSLNEELQTVNTELQCKVDDLSMVNNDMKNLLNSTELAIVFLDSKLNIRRYTTQATRLFKLIPGDIGRPLIDITSELIYPELAPQLQVDTQEVLRSLTTSDKQVTTRDGRWFKVRIMPYRTIDNLIDGLVLTFTDITESKHLEAELRKALHARNE